ncbi:MAG TPA: MmcQ/YjbR family DNA-binding protein [bacterium]
MTIPMVLPPAARKLRAAALAYPDTHEDLPWGHSAIKVRGKVFIFLSAEKGLWRLSVKLPVSAPEALRMENAEPTRYGMGKHNWVTTSFPARAVVPEEMLLDWLAESYRAIAPKAPARKKAAKKAVHSRAGATRRRKA